MKQITVEKQIGRANLTAWEAALFTLGPSPGYDNHAV